MLSENINRSASGTLTFAGQNVAELAEKYSAPLYLMDEQRIRDNIRMYKNALSAAFGDNYKVLLASKAASFKQIYRIAASEGIGSDVVSCGEIYTASAAGFPMDKVYFHGNAKTDADIAYAIEHGVGCFVVDNYEELEAVNLLAGKAGIKQRIILRVTPGIDPHTYDAISTGKVDSKFGVAIETGQAKPFVIAAAAKENLDLRGIHCHVGSQVFEEDVYERTSDIMIGFMEEIRRETGIEMTELNLGGGYGVRYLETQAKADIGARIAALAVHIKALCQKLNYPVPTIIMEPGRSIVADAGMTVYAVSSIKRIKGYKSYVAVDGGMTDNPRYALYEAPYTVLDVQDKGEKEFFDLVGRCCESGDIIQPAVQLNTDMKRGDLVAVCTTGAYNYSMASNYNRVPRLPIIMLMNGESYVAVRRESFEDVAALDV